MRKILSAEQKNKWSLIGGISGLLVGFWLIFINKNNLGFVPGILGALLLIIRRNNGK